MLTVFLCLAIAASLSTLGAAWGKVPLWIAVVFLCLIELLRSIPLGK